MQSALLWRKIIQSLVASRRLAGQDKYVGLQLRRFAKVRLSGGDTAADFTKKLTALYESPVLFRIANLKAEVVQVA